MLKIVENDGVKFLDVEDEKVEAGPFVIYLRFFKKNVALLMILNWTDGHFGKMLLGYDGLYLNAECSRKHKYDYIFEDAAKEHDVHNGFRFTIDEANDFFNEVVYLSKKI